MRLSHQNLLTQCSVYAATFGLSLGIVFPTFAADNITLHIKGKPLVVTTFQLEDYSQTGDLSSLPPEVVQEYPDLLPEEQEALRKLPAQLKRPISIRPGEQPDPDEQELINLLIPFSQQEQQQAIELIAEKGNGQILLDFLQALPVETLTKDNFISVLTSYIPPKVKPPANPNPITFSIGGLPVPGQGEFSAVPGVTTIDFESGAPISGDAIYSAPGFGPAVVSGHLDGVYWAPNNTRYLNVAPFGDERGTNPVTIDFAQPIDYFGLYWGSTDPYNSISFYQDATLIQSFTGTISPELINIYVNFFASSGETFNRVVLNSTNPALESDNHAYRFASIPEPTSVLSLFAFGALGASSLFKRKK